MNRSRSLCGPTESPRPGEALIDNRRGGDAGVTATADFRTAKQLLDEDLSRRFAWLEQFTLETIVAAKDVGAHVSVTTALSQALGLEKRARTLYESHGGA